MIENFFKKLESKAVLTNIFLAIVVQTLIQVILVLIMSPELQKFSMGKMLDVRLFYSGNEAEIYFKELGAPGRRLYFFTLLIDLIYPFAYGAAFILLILYLGKFAFRSVKREKSVNISRAAIIAPVLLFLADYLENITEIILLSTFPETNFLYHVAGYVTFIKYCLLVLSLAIVSLIGLIALKKELL